LDWKRITSGKKVLAFLEELWPIDDKWVLDSGSKSPIQPRSINFGSEEDYIRQKIVLAFLGEFNQLLTSRFWILDQNPLSSREELILDRKRTTSNKK
jgi:hypothetical protein